MCLPAVIIMVRHDRLSYDRPVFYRPAWGCDPACRGITGFPCHRNPERLWYADRGRRMRNHRKTAGWKKKEANGKLQAAACCCRWPAADCTQRYCWQVSDKLLPLLGVSEQAAPFARQYLTIAAISTPAVVFSTAFGNIIRAEGAARQSMTANLLGTLTNILLDPLFILVFGMGVTGAALATALGNLLSALYLVRYLRSAKSRLAPTLTKHGCWTSLIPILTLGLPSALGNLLMNLAGGIQNRMLTGYGDQAIAAFSVGGKAAMLVCDGRHGDCHWHSAGAGILLGAQATGSGWPGCCVASAITAVACTSLLGGIAVCCLPPSWSICSRLTRRPPNWPSGVTRGRAGDRAACWAAITSPATCCRPPGGHCLRRSPLSCGRGWY